MLSTILVFLSIVVVVFLTGFVTNKLSWRLVGKQGKTEVPQILTVVFGAISLIVCVLAIFTQMLWPANEIIVSGEKILYDNPNPLLGRVVWIKSLPKDWEIIDIEATKIRVDMKLNPITPNPKVRNLSYSVTLTTGGTAEECLLYHNWKKRNVSADRWLRYELYELNEEKSREMSKFYNPYDWRQQEAFSKLVLDWLPNDLPPSMKIESIRFEM